MPKALILKIDVGQKEGGPTGDFPPARRQCIKSFSCDHKAQSAVNRPMA
jgi:hypothetical protein